MHPLKRKLTLAALTASSFGLLFHLTVTPSPAQGNDAALIAKANTVE